MYSNGLFQTKLDVGKELACAHAVRVGALLRRFLQLFLVLLLPASLPNLLERRDHLRRDLGSKRQLVRLHQIKKQLRGRKLKYNVAGNLLVQLSARQIAMIATLRKVQ